MAVYPRPKLIEQREQKRDAAHAKAREKAAADRGAKGTDAEQGQVQQGKSHVSCVEDVAGEQEDRNRQ